MLGGVRDEGNGVDVELVLACIECGAVSTGKAAGWRALILPGEGADDELAVYCPDCAEREFEENV